MTDAGMSERALAAHAAWFAAAAASSTHGVRSSSQATHLAFARAERANIDAALAWSTTRDPLLALRLVTGFGWAWVVLGDSRGAQRILTALDAIGDAAPARDRADASAAGGVDRSVDRSPRTGPRPHRRRDRRWPTRSTTSTCRPAARTTSRTSSPTTASSATRWR